jgi:hypothetical protein
MMGGAITHLPMKKSTINLPERTLRRLQKAAASLLPRTTAPRLADAILTTDLDRREKKEGGK